MLHWQNSGNNGDMAGVLSVFSEDAQIFHNLGTTHVRIENKKEYGNMLPERMKKNPTVIVGLPEMTVTGDKAKFRAPLDTHRGALRATFYLKRQNGKWLVRKLEWYKIRR
jgi:ketosteroid isomerase-like protein